MFAPTLKHVNDRAAGMSLVVAESTGWEVDRTIFETRSRLAQASKEEQFQVIGLLCREALISLGQCVFDPAKHKPLDDKTPSATDAKRMLEAYIATELGDSSNEVLRRFKD